MFGLPAETTWVWVGLTLASAAMLAVVLGVPTAAPNAERAATAVEEVAVSEHGGEATLELRAQEIRLGPDRIGLRGPGGSAHADIRYGTIIPVPPDSKLELVLDGQPPETVFVRPATFRKAASGTRSRTPEWREAGDQLRIKWVHYGEVSGVLVGA
ncbi:MAG: hypothetical protein U5K70_00330 [Halodesulfurarchaeum sp.]|nr:hypothetical protein [Halodesulfurarchaeum sp.]